MIAASYKQIERQAHSWSMRRTGSYKGPLAETVRLLAILCMLASVASSQLQPQRSTSATRFPGVSRELESFCAARPSLQFDLAAMVVHVKRNLSFNYKLYLFSGNQVFQTGQIVPRDHFKIHAFPVKLKPLSEFWPDRVPTMRLLANGSLVAVPSGSFSPREFLRPANRRLPVPTRRRHNATSRWIPEDAHGDLLPGDPSPPTNDAPNLNRHIEFDRDDQLSLAVRRDLGAQTAAHGEPQSRQDDDSHDTQIPVAAFSSFQLNSTYLVRKDYDELEPEIVQLQVSAQQFEVTGVTLMAANQSGHQEQFQFLSHKLIRSMDTRLLAISQIYEDWITRNFYTVVYVERRFKPEPEEQWSQVDRIVFRGTSAAVLGAEQLEHSVRAAAFVTERSGLHYFMEFLSHGRFRLAAVDWTRRPFKMIDWRGLPMRATKAELDNEELLLCPPAICFSSRPLDELVAYGRLSDTDTDTDTNPGKLKLKLHLRDWTWPLFRKAGVDGDKAAGDKFQFDYVTAARNDIKAKQDSYGYLLTGHEIDASYRVSNELYLISANHLISINYTLANETVTSSELISDQFQSLSSTLLDPITGALYHEPSQKIYFFKGDRYLIYDQLTRKPLDEFTLDPLGDLKSAADPADTSLQATTSQGPLVSSSPVAQLFGRQLEVDGIFHDLDTHLVYVFSGMKFFTFHISDLKPHTRVNGVSRMRCINAHFLDGCQFDLAFPNPCDDSRDDNSMEPKAPAHDEETGKPSGPSQDLGFSDEISPLVASQAPGKLLRLANDPSQSFQEQQQMKLRSIATIQAKQQQLNQLINETSLPASEQATGGLIKKQPPAGSELHDWPQELAEPADHEPYGSAPASRPLGGQAHEQILVAYLMVAALLLTILASVLIVFILLRQWALRRQSRMAPTLAASRYLRNQQAASGQRHKHLPKPISLTSISMGDPFGSKGLSTLSSYKPPEGFLSSNSGQCRRHSSVELDPSTDSSVL